MSSAQVFDGFENLLLVHRMDFDAFTDALHERDGEFSAKVLPKFLEALQDRSFAALALGMQQIVIKVKAQFLEQLQAALGGFGLDQSNTRGVGQVDCKADGHGITVPNAKF